ncbi:MAG TPA: outer membrane beta-barrel protein [Acidobacteriaceae bacterium]
MRGLLILLFLATPALPQTPSPLAPPSSFFSRLADFYHSDWRSDPGAPASAAPARRGAASPLDSPPFPNADWPYGGSPVLGEPDTQSYPLMNAIRRANSRTKLYGWIDPSVNGSTSSHTNAPEANDEYSNRVQLNQIVVYLERLPNSVQQDHVDWGFHLTALYGTDYHYTTDRGYLSSQSVDHHRQYGFDPALEYIDVYFPHVGQGINLRMGRFISIPGIEAQLSPNNYVFSHSVLYAVDPFTDTGILATVKLSDRWLVQAGLTASHDVAPWTPDAKPSGDLCVSYTSSSVNDNLYACANGINDGKYAFNNLQHYDLTWYHKVSKTVHLATETWYMYERDVPAINGPILAEKGTTPAWCRPGQLRCTAPEYAVVDYVQKELNPHAYLSFRSDFLNDKKGQRTGYQTRYSENTLSYNRWFGSTVQLRPELRLDHAWDRPGYDDGRHSNQFTAASDLIFHF